MNLNEQFLYNPHLICFPLCIIPCMLAVFSFMNFCSTFKEVTTFCILAVSWHFLLNYYLRCAPSLSLQDGVSSPLFHMFFPLSLLILKQGRICVDLAYTSRVSILSAAGLGTLHLGEGWIPFSYLSIGSVMHTSPSLVLVFKLALTWATAVVLLGPPIFWIEGPWTQPCWVQVTGRQSPHGSHWPSRPGASHYPQPHTLSSFLL